MQVGITHCVYVFNMCELHNYVEIAHLAVFKFMTYRNNVYLGTIPIFKFSLIECKIKLYIPHLLILHTYCNQYEFRFVYRNKIVTPRHLKLCTYLRACSLLLAPSYDYKQFPAKSWDRGTILFWWVRHQNF